MDQSLRYRIIVIYADGTREILARKLTLGAAQAVESSLLQEGRFAQVILELEPPPPTEGKSPDTGAGI